MRAPGALRRDARAPYSITRTARPTGWPPAIDRNCAAISGAYAIPYIRVRDRVGDRPAAEVSAYSARPANYLSATPTNRLRAKGYGPWAWPFVTAMVHRRNSTRD